MAPLNTDAQVPEGLGDRSPGRSIFCKAVVARATEISNELFANCQCRKCFDNEDPSSLCQCLEKSPQIQPLWNAARGLLGELSKFRDWKAMDSELVMVFDDAATLFTTPDSDKEDTSRYVALNRIFSILKEFLMWFFVLSTESKIKKLLPLERSDGDEVYNYGIAKSCHRPRTYGNVQKTSLDGLQLTRKDVLSSNVKAVLSFCLPLDVCLENRKTLPIVRTAVNSHLRLVISIDHHTGILHTITPSEPVLARSAMELLCYRKYWAPAIGTFTYEILKQRVIDKGVKGKLYSCLVLILAHDWLRWDVSLQAGDHPMFAPTFTVEEFLTSLYVKQYHGAIRRLPTQLRNAALQLAPAQPIYDKLIPIYFGDEGDSFDPSQCRVIVVQDNIRAISTTVRSIFKEHFTTIDHQTSKSKLNKPEAGKSGNWRTAKQKTAKQKKTEEPALCNNNQYFIFNEIKHPVLFLLFDMGVNPINSPSIKVSYSIGNNPPVWAIHSCGQSNQVFGCIENMHLI
ncbi:MAG: hypothetical protein M1839_006760 [Geoglossum umbratile]|nr:MAG: hypothetical protein M1839_006760 [Geoglossum umbratile]